MSTNRHLRAVSPLIAAACLTAPQAGLAAGPDEPRAGEAKWPPVAYPHPLITEVLYAVPTGDSGDANGDGSRHATGDEFIEIVNPHDEPIELAGYVITDRNPRGKGQLRFELPSMTLGPGEILVAFNGYEQTWTGPVGDEHRAPPGTSDRFNGAYVFTMDAKSSRVGWANNGDYALLSSPAGEPIQCVRWGRYDEPTPRAKLDCEAPDVRYTSVRYDPTRGRFVAHDSNPGEEAFSPGRFEFPKNEAQPDGGGEGDPGFVGPPAPEGMGEGES